MNSWKAMLAVCLIFVGGALTGAFVATKAGSSGARRPLQRPAAGLGPQARLEAIRRMVRRTDLSAEQRARIDRIIDDTASRLQNRVDEIRPAMRSDVVKAVEAILSELKPDQRSDFEEKLRSRFPQLMEKPVSKTGDQPSKPSP